jgi:hypothetical protein
MATTPHNTLGSIGSILVILLGVVIALAGKSLAKLVAFLLGGAALGVLLYYLRALFLETACPSMVIDCH